MKRLVVAAVVMWVSGTATSVLYAAEAQQRVSAGAYAITLDDQDLHRIRMSAPGYGPIGSPGCPDLPRRILEFRVPSDIDWSSVSLQVVITRAAELDGAYDIAPSPPVGPVDGEWTGDANARDMEVYGRDADYPGNALAWLPNTERKVPTANGYEIEKCLKVAYHPFLYNPVQRKLTLIQEAHIRISYETAPAGEAIIPPLPTYDYVIITTSYIADNSKRLSNFVHLKKLLGHKVLVVTEADYGGLTGQVPDGTAEKIRQWLKIHYLFMGIDYVLLIGDPDPDDPTDPNDTVGDVPMKMMWPRYSSPDYRESPTDYFYADLSGNWDLDGDQRFGECVEVNHEVSPDAAIDQDTFSAVWVGKVMCDYTETYRFHTFSDDGVQLFLDGVKVIDNWTEHPPQNDNADVAMTAGKHDITVKFRENTGDGLIRLYWRTVTSSDVEHDIIPADHLYDASDVVGGLTATYYNNTDFTGTSITRKDATVNFFWGTGDRSPGGMDSGAEVYVGRIPVYNDNVAELDAILGKLIAYQTDPGDISWRERILLPMVPLWDHTPSYHLGEGIMKDIAVPAAFDYYRLYEEDYNPPTPEAWPCTKTAVKNEWANGYGMVVWATHGSAGGASHVFDNTLTSHLDDTKPAQAFQASCLNGYPENANNLGYALLREGAIGTICASRVSWEGFGAWTFDPTSGQNHNLAYYYTDKLVLGGHTAGAALYLTKGNVPTVGMNLIDYNLYGDPGCVFLSTLPNLPPVADANGPYTADEGTPILFDGSGSSDPEGDALEYRWDVDNDATWDTAWSTDPTASHAWGDDRLGAARLEVRDQLGFTDEATAAVQVNNVAPSVTLDALAQPNPQFILPVVHTLGFTGSFTDPGWLDTHVGEWDFGDGPAVPGDLTEENAEPDATGVVTGGHVYASPGVYVVELTVTDDDGGSGADTMEITVVDEFGALQDIHDYIQGQPNSVFAGPAARRRRTLCRKLGPVRKMLVTQAYRGAIHNLLNNIRAKADGGVDGKAAGDWIVDVDVQKELCMKIDDLVAYLEYLLAL